LSKHLHIITHDVPFPLDFGGVTDLYCKIKALHQEDVAIHLHSFTDKRQEQSILNQLCASVHYYPRMKGPGFIFSWLPFIVWGRRSKALLHRLQSDNHPVLIEGVHCSFLLYKGLLRNRSVVLRLHNVEYLYYKNLASHERNFIRKCYYKLESILLKRFEKKIAGLAPVWTVSENDAHIYKGISENVNASLLPVFLPWKEIKSASGKGSYCLYHGNLSVNENESAVIWLLEEVFSKTGLPLVIAGKNPSSKLRDKVYKFNHCCLVENPDEHELQDLINKAQLHVLPAFNQTGVKLKLLNALFNGRHCIVNNAAVDGTSFNEICIVANEADTFIHQTKKWFEIPFSEEMAMNRNTVLMNNFDNKKNVAKIIRWLP